MSAGAGVRTRFAQGVVGAALLGLVLAVATPIAGATGDPALDQLVAAPAEASWKPAPDAQISAAIEQVKKVESDLVGPSVVVQAGGRIWQDDAGRRLVVLIIGFDPSPNLQGAAQSEVVNSCLSATGAQPTATVPFAPIPGAYVATCAATTPNGPEIASFGWVSHNLLVSVIVTTTSPADRAAAETFATSQAKALPDKNLSLAAAGSSTTTSTTSTSTTVKPRTPTTSTTGTASDDDGVSPLVLGLGAVAVLAVIGGAVATVRRNGSKPSSPPSAESPPVEPTNPV